MNTLPRPASPCGSFAGGARALAFTAAAFGFAGCVLLPPGTSTGDVAASRSQPALVLSPPPGDEAESMKGWEGATRDADLRHVVLDVTVDLDGGRLTGQVTSTFMMLRPATRTLRGRATSRSRIQ